MRNFSKLGLAVVALILFFATGILGYFYLNNRSEDREITTTSTTDKARKPEEKELKSSLEPIANAKSRITKKPFGKFVTPQNSPVQPEKFTGYHTGTDFETTEAEVRETIEIMAICEGKVRVKEIVSGYGGVVVQDCNIKGQLVTVLYGHLNLRQVEALSLGQEVKKGNPIGALADANTDMSGGERKHLHLGIHKGSEIDYRGYVDEQSELSSWINAEEII